MGCLGWNNHDPMKASNEVHQVHSGPYGVGADRWRMEAKAMTTGVRSKIASCDGIFRYLQSQGGGMSNAVAFVRKAWRLASELHNSSSWLGNNLLCPKLFNYLRICYFGDTGERRGARPPDAVARRQPRIEATDKRLRRAILRNCSWERLKIQTLAFAGLKRGLEVVDRGDDRQHRGDRSFSLNHGSARLGSRSSPPLGRRWEAWSDGWFLITRRLMVIPTVTNRFWLRPFS